MIINTPISLGELIDKISILKIKKKNITAETKLVLIRKELSLLESILSNSAPALSIAVTSCPNFEKSAAKIDGDISVLFFFNITSIFNFIKLSIFICLVCFY